MVNTITLNIIIFLNVLTLGTSETVDQRCRLLTAVKWIDLCFGTVTSEMKLKYKDELTSVGTPFKIMIPTDPYFGLLVTFYESHLRNCAAFSVDTNWVATCENKGNFTIDKSMIHCFEYYLFYVNELIRMCFDPSDIDTRQLPVRFAALHYGYKPSIKEGQNPLVITARWMIYLFAAMLVWMM